MADELETKNNPLQDEPEGTNSNKEKTLDPIGNGLDPSNEPTYFRADPELKKIQPPTPEQILDKINHEIKMKKEESPESPDNVIPGETKPKKANETPDKKPAVDNTLLILGIAAVLIVIGLFLWKNYSDKKKALDAEKSEPENDANYNYPNG